MSNFGVISFTKQGVRKTITLPDVACSSKNLNLYFRYGNLRRWCYYNQRVPTSIRICLIVKLSAVPVFRNLLSIQIPKVLVKIPSRCLLFFFNKDNCIFLTTEKILFPHDTHETQKVCHSSIKDVYPCYF